MVFFAMDIFSDAQGQLTPQSMVGSVRISNPFKILWFSWFTCKNEDQNKNEGNRVATSLYINFSDAQGQLTLYQWLDLAEM